VFEIGTLYKKTPPSRVGWVTGILYGCHITRFKYPLGKIKSLPINRYQVIWQYLYIFFGLGACLRVLSDPTHSIEINIPSIEKV
jgi:hypothetical protein